MIGASRLSSVAPPPLLLLLFLSCPSSFPPSPSLHSLPFTSCYSLWLSSFSLPLSFTTSFPSYPCSVPPCFSLYSSLPTFLSSPCSFPFLPALSLRLLLLPSLCLAGKWRVEHIQEGNVRVCTCFATTP